MTTNLANYLKYICIAAVAAVLVTGGPTFALTNGDLSVLDDALGIDFGASEGHDVTPTKCTGEGGEKCKNGSDTKSFCNGADPGKSFTCKCTNKSTVWNCKCNKGPDGKNDGTASCSKVSSSSGVEVIGEAGGLAVY